MICHKLTSQYFRRNKLVNVVKKVNSGTKKVTGVKGVFTNEDLQNY